jgi:hypothetical protein
MPSTMSFPVECMSVVWKVGAVWLGRSAECSCFRDRQIYIWDFGIIIDLIVSKH